MSVYLTPEQAVEVFGFDDLNRPFVTKHEIRRFAKESGIYSTLSRGKLAFTHDELDRLKDFIITRNQNPITATGEKDHFA